MGHTLKIDDAVHCTTKEQYGRILDLAKKAGVPVYLNLRDNDYINYPFVGWDGNQLDGEDPCGKSDLNIIPEAEFVARMFGVDATSKDGPTIADLEARIAELDEKIAANQKEIERLEASVKADKDMIEHLTGDITVKFYRK